ncbi:MAG: hypothetical protein OXI43_13475 [Candidatus Poribacteria bacterium]|nr:hypothetical protein [Candidatus Poribacteria bacterium]
MLNKTTLNRALLLPLVFLFVIICSLSAVISFSSDSEDWDCQDEIDKVAKLEKDHAEAVKKYDNQNAKIFRMKVSYKYGAASRTDPFTLKLEAAINKLQELSDEATRIWKLLEAARKDLDECTPPCGHYYPPDEAYMHVEVGYECGDHKYWTCKTKESGHDVTERTCGHTWADCQNLDKFYDGHARVSYQCRNHHYWLCWDTDKLDHSAHAKELGLCGHTYWLCLKNQGNHYQYNRLACGHTLWKCRDPKGWGNREAHGIVRCPHVKLGKRCYYSWYACKYSGSGDYPSHTHYYSRPDI